MRRGRFETFTLPPPYEWVARVKINDQRVVRVSTPNVREWTL